jgi:NADH:ubiquinone oxidoreductase subunit C
MKKIETSSKNLLKDIGAFYDYKTCHFITVNGVDLGDKMEIQYLFSHYGSEKEVVCYFLHVDYEEEIPSIISLIPSAFLGEGEVVDMFGINIKDIKKGLLLEDDSMQAPLRKNQ